MTADQPRADAIAALEYIREAYTKHRVGRLGPTGVSAALATAERALSALAATPAPLDVERLAQAEWKTDQGNWFLDFEDAQAWANEVAAEYAAAWQQERTK